MTDPSTVSSFAPGAPAPGSKAGGLLTAAFQGGLLDEITWVDVTVNDIVVTVASDAVKAPLGDVPGVRLPLTYTETIAICKAMGCVTPSLLICEAMLAQAKAKLLAVGLVQTADDANRMDNVEFVLEFHTRVEAQIASHQVAPGDLLFGAWKLWILNERLGDPTVPQLPAINFGFWDGSKWIQNVGGKHDASHYDYSQLLQPVKRTAREASSGNAVDLLDWFEQVEHVPSKYLDPYR
jgi:hypothetical protein